MALSGGDFPPSIPSARSTTSAPVGHSAGACQSSSTGEAAAGCATAARAVPTASAKQAHPHSRVQTRATTTRGRITEDGPRRGTVADSLLATAIERQTPEKGSALCLGAAQRHEPISRPFDFGRRLQLRGRSLPDRAASAAARFGVAGTTAGSFAVATDRGTPLAGRRARELASTTRPAKVSTRVTDDSTRSLIIPWPARSNPTSNRCAACGRR
jgi:hypothetical protein